jgi:hypothetical protein
VSVIYLIVGCGLTIAAVFAASVGSKLFGGGALDGFAGSVRALLPVAASAARPVAGVVLAIEAAIVPLCLLAPAVGLACAAGLLTAFAVAIGRALRRGVREPCRCFGRADTPLGRRHLVRAAGLAAVAVAGCVPAWIGGERFPRGLFDGAQPAGVAVAALAATGLAAMAIVFDDVVQLFTVDQR